MATKDAPPLVALTIHYTVTSDLIWSLLFYYSDDLTLQIADYLRENPWLWKLGSICICVGVIASVILKLTGREAEKKKKAVKKDKADKEKSKKAK